MNSKKKDLGSHWLSNKLLLLNCCVYDKHNKQGMWFKGRIWTVVKLNDAAQENLIESIYSAGLSLPQLMVEAKHCGVFFGVKGSIFKHSSL